MFAASASLFLLLALALCLDTAPLFLGLTLEPTQVGLRFRCHDRMPELLVQLPPLHVHALGRAPYSLTYPRTVPRKDATAAPPAVQAVASKAAAEAKREQARAKKVRREALAATVAELRATNKKRRETPG